MQEYLISTIIIFFGFFAIMNPIVNIPVFITLTAGEDDLKTEKIAFQSVLTAFTIVLVFSIAGHLVLKFFGISLTALRLTGGIIVAIIGYDMLHGNLSKIQQPSKETVSKCMKEDTSIAFTPLGTPLLAGPGVIITTMNFSTYGKLYVLITIISFAILCCITYFSLKSGRKIKYRLGTSFFNITTRMMGLILAVIGVQMFIQGIYSAINQFS